MAGLRPPPKPDAPSRVLLRIITLLILVLVAGVVVWAAVTNQRIDLAEDTPLESLELTPFVTSEGTALNVVREGEGTVPLVLLHDADVAGSVLWDGVVASLDPGFDIMRVDLPGWGLSERLPEEGSGHTVASMAVAVGEVMTASFDQPALIAGVGLGGEVASEIAVNSPELVAGVVMIDVDFYSRDGWLEFVEKLPFIGRPVTYAFEAGGSFAAGRWAPNCDTGGWCPSQSQVEARNLAETITGTTDSVRAYRRTPAASLVPSKLSEITAPVSYLFSEKGDVPRESVDKVVEALPDTTVEVYADAWKAHLDLPAEVASAVSALLPSG
jgi:pimeloyl-ACP methyl ester carboxylesterase